MSGQVDLQDASSPETFVWRWQSRFCNGGSRFAGNYSAVGELCELELDL